MPVCPVCYRENEPVAGRCPDCGSARADPASAILAVVYDIAVTADVKGPQGSGGKLLLIDNWHIEENTLEPLTFRYTVPIRPSP